MIRIRLAISFVVRVILRPFIFAYYRDGLPTKLSAGGPPDDPHGVFPGSDPDRILILGGIAGAGVGIRSFQLGVASVCAETSSRLTGRGAEWHSRAEVPTRRADTRHELPDLHRFDAIVLFPGIQAVLGLTSPRRWARDIDRTLDFLTSGAASDATIVVTTFPQVADRVQGPTFLRSMVRDHTHVLNAYTQKVASQRPGVHLARMPAIDKRMIVDDLFSYARLYRIWGAHLGELIVNRREKPTMTDTER